MKLHPACIPCLVNWAYKQAWQATSDEAVRFRAVTAFLRFLSENASERTVPAKLGTEKNRIIKELTSNPDPYLKQKELSTRVALELRPYVDGVMDAKGDDERLRLALTFAVIGNSMEYGVAGYEFNGEAFKEELDRLIARGLDYDDSDKIIHKIRDGREILYLLDNAGEAVLDQIFMEELRKTGAEIWAAAKTEPVQDDVTVEDLRNLGIDKVAKILPAGSSVGVDFERSPREFLEKFESADLIISKGMGNYETISEVEGRLKRRLAYLLRAKCQPVAESLGVEKGALVAKLVT